MLIQNKMKNLFIILALIAIYCSCHGKNDHVFYASNNDTAMDSTLNKAQDTSIHIGTIMEVVKRITEEISNVPGKGNSDLTYAGIMIIYNKSILEMCEIQMSQGGHTEVAIIAQNISNINKSQLLIFQTFLNHFKLSENPDSLNYKIPFDLKNIERMAHSGTTIDNQFLEMLATIQQSELAISKVYLKNGKNDKLRTIAKRIIASNQIVISELRSKKRD